MKKGIIKIAFLMLICALLAGCSSESIAPACQHQWSEADCLNASVCALCSEVQTEALGHDWAEATCESPESCTRCGETQGEALAHSFGDLHLGESDMYRVCTVCSSRESETIDYAAYLKQEIAGNWNLTYVISGTNYQYAENMPCDRPDTEIVFNADGSFVFVNGTSGAWAFERGEYDSSSGQHIIYITMGAGTKEAYFSCIDDNITFTMTDSKGDIYALSKAHGDIIASLISGSWAAYYENELYSITFSEDRSFTADFDGEISGHWQARPFEYNGYNYNTDILLSYSKDSKEKTVSLSISSFYADMSQQYQKGTMDLMFYDDDRFMRFSLDSMEALTAAVENIPTAPLGNWTSVAFNAYSSGTENTGSSTEYSITFLEDGSFTANLHKELQGKWELREILVDSSGTGYTYHIIAPGASEYSYFSVRADGSGYLYLSTGSDSYNYDFKQMSEEEIAEQNKLIEEAPTKVVDEWFANDGSDNSVVFNEDGTFTISLGGEQHNGHWRFKSMYEYDDTIYYYYDIETDYATFYPMVYGPDFDYSELVDPEDSSGYVEENALYLTVRNGSSSLEFNSYLSYGKFINATGLAAAKEAASSLVGHWSSDTAFVYDAASQQSTELSGEFYIDIAEDGSFSGYAGREVFGTWSYFETENDVPRFLLEINDVEMGSILTLNKDCLSGYFDPYIIDFYK